MYTFANFQNEVRNLIDMHHYTLEDIDYINLSNKYSLCTKVFFELQQTPNVISNDELAKVSWCNSWYLPEGFKIVMKNGSMFIYIATQDEYYSRWVHVEPPKQSPTEITIHSDGVAITNRDIWYS